VLLKRSDRLCVDRIIAFGAKFIRIAYPETQLYTCMIIVKNQIDVATISLSLSSTL
jgi:hypothetical protein